MEPFRRYVSRIAKPHAESWHAEFLRRLFRRRKNLSRQYPFWLSEETAATDSNLIFNYVIDDININIFDIVWKAHVIHCQIIQMYSPIIA